MDDDIPISLTNNWTVHIYWPVPDGSGLMQDPSIEQWQSPSVKQAVSFGDKDRCNRIGVSVDRSKGLSIGAALGFKTRG